MSKNIVCVFQDCAMCGDRGKTLKKFIISEKLNFRLVSFASEEGKELIYQAVTEHGIKTMPFFTDGEKFSINIEDFGKSAKENGEVTTKPKITKRQKKGARK